ncbi:MAG: isoprenylcysteine carboxylmethyltransferase family protein [Planctomycetes bacterium]|nr:isoprenylcysteine carboxylmethyltransferase family protein [Planctomycetota bacterium]
MALRSMHLEEFAGLFVLVLVVLVSAYYYDHSERRYARGRRAHASVGSFRLAYGYMRITTIVAGTLAFVTESPLLLDIHDDNVLLFVGMVIALAGLTLFVVSKRRLGAAYSPCYDAHLPGMIVSDGPYRFVRHPIYTGNFLVLFGLFAMTGSVWILLNAILLAMYAARSARLEERALESALPGYRSYRNATGRFVPRLGPRR